LQSNCEGVGGSIEFNMFRENPILGAIDKTRPRQYGKELPLRNDVIVREEITVVFTEPINCASLSIQVTIKDLMTQPPNKDTELNQTPHLLVTCEGRKIGFQIDLTFGLEPERLIGKSFSVRMTGIRDINGNDMKEEKNTVEFSKRFGNLDLSTASTSFTITMKDVECYDMTVETQSDTVRNKTAELIGTNDVNSIVIQDISCHNRNTLLASVELQSPPKGTRRLCNTSKGSMAGIVENSFDRYSKMQETLNGVLIMDERRLALEIQIHSVSITPSGANVSDQPRSIGRRRKVVPYVNYMYACR
jgi:hypothetical protein